MTALTVVIFLVGLAVLVLGAELFVAAASRLARTMGVSPLVIGLTVVAFGTSAPELAVSLTGALHGSPDVSVGNVVGSSIFNVLVVLGLSALLAPLYVCRQVVRIEVPVMILASIAVYLLVLDGRLGRLEGLALFLSAVAYTAWSLVKSRREQREPEPEETSPWPLWGQLVGLAAGLGLIVLGAHAMVDAAVVMAKHFGVSELVISLTVVAAGTSLPEIATSLIAARRGQGDLAVGNVIGSNLFNLLFVLGLTGALTPGGLEANPAAVSFDLPVMIAVAAACLPVMIVGKAITRWEGAAFLAYYVAYAAYVLLRATQHDSLGAFSTVMLAFVIPITALTLGALLYRDARARRATALAGPPGPPEETP